MGRRYFEFTPLPILCGLRFGLAAFFKTGVTEFGTPLTLFVRPPFGPPTAQHKSYKGMGVSRGRIILGPAANRGGLRILAPLKLISLRDSRRGNSRLRGLEDGEIWDGNQIGDGIIEFSILGDGGLEES